MTAFRVTIATIVLTVSALAAAAPVASATVYTSGPGVRAWDPIYPTSIDFNWPSTTCVPTPAVGLGAAWANPHEATSFPPGTHPWEGSAGFTAPWINAWSDIGSRGAYGHSWTRYQTAVSGEGDFVLHLLADNCSWVYLDGVLVGFQDAYWSNLAYPVSLSGDHTLDFIIFDGGGAAGGMYRLETNTGTEFRDRDEDGLTDPEETLYGTNPSNPDTDGDGVTDGDEVDAGTDPRVPDAVRDGDHDGVPDDADNCATTANADQADADGDGLGDACDSDRDGDGVANDADAFPDDASESRDTDGDGVGDNADNCAAVANADQADADGDGLGDACDDDRDGDGVANAGDAFPDDASESADNDGDGIGDNADQDDDNDGVADGSDNCATVANPDQKDRDKDGVGSACETGDENRGHGNDADGFDEDNPGKKAGPVPRR